MKGAHLLIGDEVFEAELAELIRSPRVELAKDLTLLNTSDFFADVGRVGVEEGASTTSATLGVTPVRILAHLVVRKGHRRWLRTSNDLRILPKYNLLDGLSVPL
jgi:hypothetical protein